MLAQEFVREDVLLQAAQFVVMETVMQAKLAQIVQLIVVVVLDAKFHLLPHQTHNIPNTLLGAAHAVMRTECVRLAKERIQTFHLETIQEHVIRSMFVFLEQEPVMLSLSATNPAAEPPQPQLQNPPQRLRRQPWLALASKRTLLHRPSTLR